MSCACPCTARYLFAVPPAAQYLLIEPQDLTDSDEEYLLLEGIADQDGKPLELEL